ncbi:MAG TPA: prepilin-type N-terminal cleavage/methylation domain-containing protein [Burkholderiales bacterium]|nr:prepilin-type N-terminal cleavage/methylation domain-containing protein [Burkholderiales bacterium]
MTGDWRQAPTRLARDSSVVSRQSSPGSGFTLVELLIVLALIATLLTIALPRYFGSLERSKEAALKQTLAATRDAIDKFFTDNGKYPDSLPELVDKRYLRSLPVDPITESTTTWTIVPAPQESAARGEIKGEVYDVRSGAEGKASDGKPYAEF